MIGLFVSPPTCAKLKVKLSVSSWEAEPIH